MQIVKRVLELCVCGAFGMSSCYAVGEVSAQAVSSTQTAEPASGATVSAAKIREALRAPDEESSNTPLGILVIKSSNDSTHTPGMIFLNGELIYTARKQEAIPHLRGRPFNLSRIDFQTNGKNHPEYRITRMVVEERSWTCQYIVLDFTGPAVWISERFPKEAFQKGRCVDITWVRWEKQLAYFYFGADDQNWEKGRYRGWVEGYNPKLKAVFGPVDAPPPPKGASFVPKLKPH